MDKSNSGEDVTPQTLSLIALVERLFLLTATTGRRPLRASVLLARQWHDAIDEALGRRSRCVVASILRRSSQIPEVRSAGVFERFTDRARRIVVLAQEEARLLNHNYIGTEHLLLGLVHEGHGVAAQALLAMGVSREAVRARTEDIVGLGGGSPAGHIPFTPRAKTVLELSLREALRLGHNYIGTEHVLLALVREGDGVAAQVLVQLGADLNRVRQAVLQVLSSYSGPAGPGSDTFVELAGEDIAIAMARSEPVETSRSGSTDPVPERCVLCAGDLWEAHHYVAGVRGSVCDRCIGEAARLLGAANDAGGRRVVMPPRVFGQPPNDPNAANTVHLVVLRAFRAEEPLAERESAIEDSAALGHLVEQVARGLVEDGVRVERIRFVDDAHAEVLVRLVGERRNLIFEGAVVVSDGTWRVSRATVCHVLKHFRVECPGPDGEPPAA